MIAAPAQHWSSSNGVELEDTATLGRVNGVSESDSIDGPNELDAERDAARQWTKNVAKEGNSLRLVELGRADVLALPAHGDRRAAGGAQIAHPVNVAPRRPDPAP